MHRSNRGAKEFGLCPPSMHLASSAEDFGSDGGKTALHF